MENSIVKLDWPSINRRISILGTTLRREFPGRDTIYGVPRGGAIVAGLLQAEGFVPVPTPTAALIAVDDIIDSGKTRKDFLAKYDMPFFGLVDKQGEDSSMAGYWIEFPWEEPGGRDIEDSLTRILEYIGENPSRDGLKDTPARVVKSWAEIYGGYRMDPKEILSKTFQEEKYAEQLVCLDNIEFYSTCEHHMQPFFGKAHVAYLPKNKVVGISKLARLVECFARRLQIQERLTGQIADALFDLTESNGVGVMIEAKHFCMICRGVHKQNSIMRTSALRGHFFTDPQLRQEFFSLIQRKAEI